MILQWLRILSLKRKGDKQIGRPLDRLIAQLSRSGM